MNISVSQSMKNKMVLIFSFFGVFAYGTEQESNGKINGIEQKNDSSSEISRVKGLLNIALKKGLVWDLIDCEGAPIGLTTKCPKSIESPRVISRGNNGETWINYRDFSEDKDKGLVKQYRISQAFCRFIYEKGCKADIQYFPGCCSDLSLVSKEVVTEDLVSLPSCNTDSFKNRSTMNPGVLALIGSYAAVKSRKLEKDNGQNLQSKPSYRGACHVCIFESEGSPEQDSLIAKCGSELLEIKLDNFAFKDEGATPGTSQNAEETMELWRKSILEKDETDSD